MDFYSKPIDKSWTENAIISRWPLTPTSLITAAAAHNNSICMRASASDGGRLYPSKRALSAQSNEFITCLFFMTNNLYYQVFQGEDDDDDDVVNKLLEIVSGGGLFSK